MVLGQPRTLREEVALAARIIKDKEVETSLATLVIAPTYVIAWPYGHWLA